MYRANRGYPEQPPGGFMGHESLEEHNQELEGELKVSKKLILNNVVTLNL